MISAVSSSANPLQAFSSTTSTRKMFDRPAAPPDPATVFKTIDANNDGSVTESEFTTAMQKMQQQEPPPGPPPGGKEPPKAADLFKLIDSDSDGKITLEEMQADFDARAKELGATASTPATNFSQLFAKLDSNSDGQIGEIEFKTLMETLSQARSPQFGPAYNQAGSSANSSSNTFLVGYA
jgi:Ca2+-binding EF-hand superfamily protein